MVLSFSMEYLSVHVIQINDDRSKKKLKEQIFFYNSPKWLVDISTKRMNEALRTWSFILTAEAIERCTWKGKRMREKKNHNIYRFPSLFLAVVWRFFFQIKYHHIIFYTRLPPPPQTNYYSNTLKTHVSCARVFKLCRY